MPRRPQSLTSDHSNNDRPEPRLIKAIEANNFQKLRDVIEDVQRSTISSPNLLSIGLVRACDRNSILFARYLLSYEANPNYAPGNKLSSLLRAAECGYEEVARLLVEHHANLEIRDKKGRSSLMTAAWKGHLGIVQLLLVAGADLHGVDHRRRNVLHNLAADNARHRITRMDLVDYLLQAGINLDARDELGRTALHWTCVTDNRALMTKLLQTRTSGGALEAEVNVTDARMRTPLHLAADRGHEAIAKKLLLHGADVQAESDGGWTALHNACTRGSSELVEALLAAGANANAKLVNGRTPLHVAAEAGNGAAVRCLLAQPKVQRALKDRFENTPLLLAAQRGYKEIAEMLSPWNNLDLLSDDEISASKSFNATIVDFGDFKNENKVSRRSVYDLLYARDERDDTKHAISTLPSNIKASNFRWIHLPANDIAWAEALLMKRFIEEGSNDTEGYKALATSFIQQHRGQKYHSRFMRPTCQLLQKSTAADEESSIAETPEPPSILVHEPLAMSGSTSSRDKPDQPDTRGKNPKQRSSENAPDGSKSPNASGPNAPRAHPRKSPRKQSRHSLDKGATLARKGAGSSYNVYMFMPYLHFETDQRRQEMQNAVEHADDLHLRAALIEDEVLIRAHLSKSSSFLHVRRTLDQFFYHNIDTQVRDCDQVVYRFQKKNRNDAQADPKIFMVDQLWMWVLGKDLVVTGFPQRWRQPRNDPLNVLEGIIEDINSKTREPVQNVHDLAMTIAGRCFGTFDRHRKGDNEFQFFDMFEASIGNAMDLEATLFQDFSAASRQASAWLLHQQRPNKFSKHLEATSKAHQHAVAKDHQSHSPLSPADPDSPFHHEHEPLFVDKLLDVGAETDLLAEIKDIRDELDIIKMILSSQRHLLPELRDAIKTIYRDERGAAPLRKLDKTFGDHDKLIANPIKDIERMDKQAERIYTSIRDLLDLKQKHANAFEARFARDQAAGTVRQGQTIMVFTIVTVIFLPLSFIAALFAINIASFPHNAAGAVELSLSYVASYTFGIGLAISIPCIVMALTVDELAYALAQAKRRLRRAWWRWRHPHAPPSPPTAPDLHTLAIKQNLSIAKSLRRSLEADLHESLYPRRINGTATRTPAEHPSAPTSRAPGRRRIILRDIDDEAPWDVERGSGRP